MRNRAATAQLPGQGSMWFFVLGDLWIFVCYFACYVHDRSQNHTAFLEGQRQLSQSIGVANTVVLLTSSLCVALCVHAARARDLRIASRFVALGVALGAVFMLVKAFEWSAKVRAGMPAGTEDFFLYYFMLTGLHVVHVCLGLLILSLMGRELRARAPRLALIEAGGIYWHMVDALWLAIFALLYLMR